MYNAAAPTRPLPERDASVHHIQTPAPTVTSFSVAQHCTALLAVPLSSSRMVLTTGSSTGGGQLMPSALWLCLCFISATRCFGVLEEGSLCISLSLLLYAFASLAAHCCCLESNITGAGVSPDSLINAPLGLWAARPGWTWLVD